MAAPQPQDRMFPRWLMALLGVLIVGYLLYVLRGVLTPIFFAFLIAYMLDPLVDRFEAIRIPRALGIVLLLTLVLGTISVFMLLALPSIIRDIAAFAQELPAKVERFALQVQPYFEYYGIPIPHSLDEGLTQLLKQWPTERVQPLRPIQRDVRDVVSHFVDDVFVIRHSYLP